MKLSNDFHNFRDYLGSLSAPYSEYCFGANDLKSNETLRLFIFGGVSCEASPLEYSKMKVEGVHTMGKATSEPEMIELRATRVSANLRPELMLLWSEHKSNFKEASSFYATVLLDKSGSLSKKVNLNLSSMRHLLYIISGR